MKYEIKCVRLTILFLYLFIFLKFHFTFTAGLHQRCVNITKTSNDYKSQQSDVTDISSEEDKGYKSALSQLATTCQQSVLSYGEDVSDAFMLQGFNCTTEDSDVDLTENNVTKAMHCPAGSICCSGKCYGQIKKNGLTPTIIKPKCDPGQL